ncbi:MAG: PQQ-binding-like beta-propeller repeat protein, partial [Micromonosporaceae bacterium]
MVNQKLAAALVALACTAVAGCSLSGAEPPTVRPNAAERTPAWSITPSDGYGATVTAQIAGSHLVMVFERQVAVLDRKTGEKRWSVGATFPNSLQPARESVRVTSDALVLLQESESGEDPGRATVYDLASGKERAALEYGRTAHRRSNAKGWVAVTADTLLVVNALPGQSGEDAGQAFESVDLSTGRALWRQESRARTRMSPAHHSNWSKAPPPRDPLLAPETTLIALQGYEEVGQGREDRLRIIDPRTGRTVGGPATMPRHGTVALIDDTRYAVWANSSASCGTSVTGYDVATAKLAWRQEAAGWRSEPTNECGLFWGPLLIEGRMLMHTPDERPILVDPADGEATWTGPEGHYPIGVTGDVVLTRDSRKDDALEGYDIGESRRLWSGPDPGAYRKESDTVVPDYAILTGAGFSDVWT